ncbi:isochorismate synthase MenF [Anaerolineales bacterium]
MNERNEGIGRLISLALPCPPIGFQKFLSYGAGQARMYWESSQSELAFAGFGTVVELAGWGEERFQQIAEAAADLFQDAILLNRLAPPESAPRLFGGFSFRDDFIPDNTWSYFSPAHFILPHFQLSRIGDQYWLRLNASIPDDEDISDIEPELEQALQARIRDLSSGDWQDHPTQHPPLAAQQVNYPLPYEVWEQTIESARRLMQAGQLNKVVLSRIAEIQFNDTIDIIQALDYLEKHYAACYRFLYEPRPRHAFYGASPEIIINVQGDSFQTMALAGSMKRGQTPAEDQALGQQLLEDPKEAYEHQLVIDQIEQRLGPLTSQLDIGQTGLYKLSNIQHIYTPIKGRLKKANGVLPLLQLLHPTPALGGDPREIAIDLIRHSEPVPRGWYAAPVGYLDSQLDGCFAVAIRSAIAQEKRVWLYAGAGIVQESQPEKEWQETALKFKPMLEALHIQEQVDVH